MALQASKQDMPGLPGAAPVDDIVMPFEAEGLEVRGRIVRLGPAVDAILSRHAYPSAVSRLLGEAIALTALLASSIKFEGRFILQTQSDGPVSMMVADFDTPDRIRACASFDEARLAEAEAGGPAALLGTGHLAMTVDQGADTSRYQGIVPLEGEGLSAAADLYFRQSEQIPTCVRLAVAESIQPGGATPADAAAWRAGGILVQYVPGGGLRPRDLDPGAAPAGMEPSPQAGAGELPDSWTEALALTETVEAHELTDPLLAPQDLLLRLFHERGVRVFDTLGLVENCNCSREQTGLLLQRFTAEERAEMIEDTGDISVTCQFCSTRYRFDPADF